MTSTHWLAVFPEIVLLVMACVIAVVDLFVTAPDRRPTFLLSVATLVAVGLLHLLALDAGQTQYVMGRMLVVDPLGHTLAFFACVALLVTLIYAQVYASSRDLLKGELFTLSLFALLGISIMVAGNNFLVIYLGLEVMSLSLYALAALRRDHAQATEAAMKYFVLGALASGFLLYGLSMMYGATGSLDVPRVLQVLQTGQPNKQVIAFGLAFIVAGLAFKFGAVPFHMWVPDVYHGAPTAVTLMIAGAPKIAAFGMAFRLLVEGLSAQAGDWQQMLMVLSVGSLVIGNLAAIAQTNLKRMLAYSTISQIGFMLLGFTPTVVAGSTTSAVNGYSSALFYLVTYVLTTLGTFGLIMLLARPGHEAEEIGDLAGLNQRSPAMALIMAVFMFSLAGVPPAVGFYAKLAVLQSLVATGENFYIGLAIFAVMASLVGAFYYLRVVKVMYFDEASDKAAMVAAPGAHAMLSANGLAVLVLGVFPGGLMALCSQAVLKALAT